VAVAAKFSKEFYDKLGHRVADELVDWLNAVDATYRLDLRELNELNFARFDAKLEQRFAEQDARWERRFAELDAKWERRLAQLDAKWEQRLAQVEAKWEQRLSQVHASLLRWMVGLGVTGFGITIGLLKLWTS
jgi:hypothetical protein